MAQRKQTIALYDAVVMFDYNAEEKTELTVKKGQIVQVKETNPSGWCLVKLEGKTGWVPLDFVERVDGLQSIGGYEPAQQQQEQQQEQQQQEQQQQQQQPPPSQLEPSAADEEAAKVLQELNLDQKPKEICASCNEPIADRFVVAGAKTYHVHHFACKVCSMPLAGKPYIEKNGAFYCEDDFYRTFNPACAACNNVIKGKYVTALGQSWHPEHFVCAECNKPFESNQFCKHDDKPYCQDDYNKLFGSHCSKCGQFIDGQIFEALGKKFHLNCFTCEVGGHKIDATSNFHVYEEKVYCPQHFEDMFLESCAGCGQKIKAEYVKVLDNHYHPQCWKCADCSAPIDRSNVQQFNSQFFCQKCYAKKKPAASPSTPTPTPTVGDNKATTTEGPKKQAPTTAASESKEEVREHVAGQLYYTISQLSGSNLPPGVDKLKKEQYLSPDVFEKVFKMTPTDFYSMKAWKQQQMKRAVGLF